MIHHRPLTARYRDPTINGTESRECQGIMPIFVKHQRRRRACQWVSIGRSPGVTRARQVDRAAHVSLDEQTKRVVTWCQKAHFDIGGVKVVVDTTEKAEFDIRGYQIPDATMETIANQLRDVSFSRHDRIIGDARVREIDGYDIIFIIGREDDTMVITIGAVILPDPDSPTEDLL